MRRPTEDEEIPLTIAYDVELKQPGCVLIQALFSTSISNFEISKHFDSSDWLLAPTKGMRVYTITEDQLKQLALITATREKT